MLTPTPESSGTEMLGALEGNQYRNFQPHLWEPSPLGEDNYTESDSPAVRAPVGKIASSFRA